MTSIEPTAAESGSASLCLLLGIVFLLVGGYFLIVAPSASNSTLGGESIANLHRLTIGRTSAVVGAIFLAAALRPRR